MWQNALDTALAALALPEYGFSTVFFVAFLSATFLPFGSEPAVFGLVQLNPSWFWPAIAVATVGNTLGEVVTWWMGFGAKRSLERRRSGDVAAASSHSARALRWLERFGPKACVFSFLPLVGDPLCAVAGWLKLPLWQCTAYMAVGKFLRYWLMTSILVAGVHAGQSMLSGA